MLIFLKLCLLILLQLSIIGIVHSLDNDAEKEANLNQDVEKLETLTRNDDMMQEEDENDRLKGSDSNKADLDYRDCNPEDCVPKHLCTSNNTINDNGEGIIDLRFGSTESQCHYLETCCATEDRTDVPKLPKSNIRKGCGNRYTDGVGFRISGSDNEAQFGEFPWMMAIMRQEDSHGKPLNVYICGGSLIHPRVILTAAHCVQEKVPSRLKVRAGEWDTQTINEIWPHQDRTVQRIILHEDFYRGALYNDVALVLLEEPVDINENVQTVCLPPQNFNFDHELCAASGWGKNLFGQEGKYQVILKKIELPIVPSSICQSFLRKTRLGKHFNLHSSFICAGGEKGKDTCKGDGGSPLVCRIPDTEHQYYQAGIVAWGVGCGEDKVPGIYVQVATFREWIDQHFHSMKLETSYYTDYNGNNS